MVDGGCGPGDRDGSCPAHGCRRLDSGLKAYELGVRLKLNQVAKCCSGCGDPRNGGQGSSLRDQEVRDLHGILTYLARSAVTDGGCFWSAA